MEYKVVLITGVTGAVGQGILKTLIQTYSKLIIYGSSRSTKRASKAFASFTQQLHLSQQLKVKSGDIRLLPLEIENCDVRSIRLACDIILKENSYLDLLFLNAGGIVFKELDRFTLVKQMICDINDFTLNPKFIIQDSKAKTSLGLSQSFSINVFGHYVLAELLQPILANSKDGRILWTGSSEGKKEYFDINDIEGKESQNAYGSNKHCLHLISELLNDFYKKNELNILSMVSNPGILPSNICKSVSFSFIVDYIMPTSSLIMRTLLGMEDLTITPEKSAVALIYLATIPKNQISSNLRYDAVCSSTGRSGIRVRDSCNLTRFDAELLKNHLNLLKRQVGFFQRF